MTLSLADARATRSLSVLESIHMLSANTLWYTFRVEGPLDLAALRQAWDLLRAEHPVLAARISPSAGNPGLPLPGFELALPERPRPGELVVQDHGANLVPYSIREGEEVALVDVIPHDEGHLVSFVVLHSVADGRLGYYWAGRLWSHYTDLAEGLSPAVEPVPVPKSPEELLAERGVEKIDQGPRRAELVAPANLPDQAFVRPVRERVQLSASTTSLLRRYAKSRGQTMHGLVAGAIATMMRRALPAPDGSAVPIALISPVDLRERFDPPVPIWGGTNVLGDAHAVVQARPDSDPAQLGAEILGQLHEDLAAGVVHQDFFHFLEFFTDEQPKIPHTITTNLGVLDPVRMPRGTVAADFTCWVETDWSPIIAMLREWGQSGSHPLMGPLHLISTYQGRLAVDVSLPMPASAARAYARELEELFVEMSARQP